MRPNVAEKLREANPDINVIVADAQEPLPFEDRFFDRILAVHVLEHLPNLPACIKELHRLCRGELLIVIPCEGGLAYSLARKISAGVSTIDAMADRISGFIRANTSTCRRRFSRNFSLTFASNTANFFR
jgi:SAM-dependent methyltransferase